MNNTPIEQNITNGVYTGPLVWKGDLHLNKYKDTLTSLGCLREVTGLLSAQRCEKLIDLGDLTTVGGYLDLEDCIHLKTLGKLTTVGALDVENCSNLVSLGNLTTVSRVVYKVKYYGQNPSAHRPHTFTLRTSMPGEQFLERVKNYQELPLHEALNAVHSKEVQEIPLYYTILLNNLQGVYFPPCATTN